MIEPLKKPNPVNAGKPGTHISLNKEYTPIPKELLEELDACGVMVERSPLRFRLYDKLMLFPHVVHTENQDFYIQFVPNYWAKKNWNSYPIWNPRALEYVARNNDLNIIFVYEKDICRHGYSFVAQCISEKVLCPSRDNSLVSIKHTPSQSIIEIVYDGEKVGKLYYVLSKTAISITSWDCIVSPRIWIEKVAEELSREDKAKRVLKFSFHPCGITRTDDFMSFSKKMHSTEMNIYIDKDNHILQSQGWRAQIMLPWNCNKDLFSGGITRDLPLLHYPLYESRQKKNIDESKKVKNNSILMSKLSSDNPSEVFEMSYGSKKYAQFTCEKGHKYQAMINEQVRFGCPVCSGSTVIPGVNDLKTTDPIIAKDWDYERSFPYRPEDFTRQSDRIVSWICPVSGGKWDTTINSRMSNQSSPFVTSISLLSGFNDIATRFPDLVPMYSSDNDIDMDCIKSVSYKKRLIWECPECGGKWARSIRTMIERPRCLVCSKEYGSTSIGEREVLHYIRSIVDEEKSVISNDRDTIGKELDIYIPDLHLAIEFNGLYWHTEEHGKDRSYHHNKWKQCRDQGIQLITIWEDEWRDKKDIVKSMLVHKLGVSQDRRVYARKTVLTPLESSMARSFLDSYHIQGFCSGSAYFGLYDDSNELIAVSVWRKNKNILYLDRYATSCTVVGGMGKMLKKGKELAREYGYDKIVTFSDHQVSDGGLYDKLGFDKDKEIPPDYRYFVQRERRHKFGYRLKRFKNDPHLIYKEGLTEKELARLNGLERIWDCGKTRWVMDIS